MSAPDLRAEIARKIVAPFRAFAPIEMCDQAEQDIIDCLPTTVRRVEDRREAGVVAMQLSLLGESSV
jgi:hypothetical protein